MCTNCEPHYFIHTNKTLFIVTVSTSCVKKLSSILECSQNIQNPSKFHELHDIQVKYDKLIRAR